MNRLAYAFVAGIWFWLGAAVGLVVERRRPFGSDYWRRHAELAAELHSERARQHAAAAEELS